MPSDSVAVPVPVAMDPSRCPLCGEGNGCAMAGGGPAVDCWCMTARIPQALLQGMPIDARRRACVCAQCAASPLPSPATEPTP